MFHFLYCSLIVSKVICLYYNKSVPSQYFPPQFALSAVGYERGRKVCLTFLLFLYNIVRHSVSVQSAQSPLLLYWLKTVYLYFVKSPALIVKMIHFAPPLTFPLASVLRNPTCVHNRH